MVIILGPEWKYHVTIRNEDWEAAQAWCNHYIGKFDEDWYKLGIDPAEYILFGETRTTWYFKREEDIVLFMLKWQ